MIRVGLSQIVSSMRHRKSAYSSLVLEVALGCTVVAYSLGLGDALRDLSQRPLGFNIERMYSVTLETADPASASRLAEAELAEIRALDGVEAASFVELPPLSRRELPESFMTHAGPKLAWVLRGDASTVSTLGLELAAGRALVAADQNASSAVPVLVTPGLARQLGSGALGSVLSAPGVGSFKVVGILARDVRLAPFYAPNAELLIVPELPSASRRRHFLVRARAEAGLDFVRSASAALGAPPGRHVEVEGLAQMRKQVVRNVGGAESIIAITVLGMVAVVLVGSIGMASSLIVERRRQIGIRRALGARRSDIVGYFMLENMLATVLGIAIAVGCCAMLDQFLAPMRATLAIAWREYLPLAGGLFLVAGQISVWLPARRAACGAPCIVARAG